MSSKPSTVDLSFMPSVAGSTTPFVITSDKRYPNIRLLELSIFPGRSTDWRDSEWSAFRYAIEGLYMESGLERDWMLTRGGALFRQAGERFRFGAGEEGASVFIVEVDPAYADSLLEPRQKIETGVMVHSSFGPRILSRIYREFTGEDDLSEMTVVGLVDLLVTEGVRNTQLAPLTSGPKWLKRAQEIVRSRFNQSLTLEGLAAEVGIHPVHLSRTFSERLGCTLGEFTRQVRVEYACREIAFTRKPMSEIAREAGFGDQSQFSHVFKRHVGVTPLEYRRIWRSNRAAV